MKLRPLALALAVFWSAATAMAEAPPSLHSPEWAQGPYSSMHMLLEKTVLNVDVLTLDVRVGKEVHRRFVELIGGKPYSEQLGDRLAEAVIKADDALIQVRFLRAVSWDQWLEGAIENLAYAEAAKLITPEVRRRVQEQLPVTFAALKERGYERGDRLLYLVRPNAVRMVVVSEKGKLYVDRTEVGKDPPYVVLASYFAPKNDFREPLLRSLFD